MKPRSRFLSYVAVSAAAGTVGFLVLPRLVEQRPPLPPGALWSGDSAERPPVARADASLKTAGCRIAAA
jgi:hypothetical protein